MTDNELKNCLLKGEIPEISGERILSFPYEEGEGLKGGLIPPSLNDHLELIGIYKVREAGRRDLFGIADLRMEDKLQLALEGNFVRDLTLDKVYCPSGFVLSKKSTKKGGIIRYFSKAACTSCTSRCFSGNTNKWKEIDFPDGYLIKGLGSRVVYRLH